MKKFKILFFVTVVMFHNNISAQIGIGTSNPDKSSILDLTATNKGLLVPRMSEAKRDSIILPPNGLIIFNTTSNAIEINSGTSTIKSWGGLSGSSSAATGFLSVNEAGETTTMSPIDVVIPGMTLSPQPGTYSVLFNSQYNSAPYNYDVNITQQGVSDLQAAYDKLMIIPTTNSTHAPVFGNGEELKAGVFSTGAATSVSGTLILDGQGNPNAVFIFKIGGAFTSSAGSEIVLVNAASACNVFWIAEGAIALAAATKMKGTLLGHNGAVGMAAGCQLIGRLFSTMGAVTTDSSTVSIPSNCSFVNIGVLSSFALYTSVGAVTNAGVSSVTGDIGSNVGLISGFTTSILIGTTYTNSSPLVNIDANVLATFSVYQNGVLVPNSSRTRRSKADTSDVSLHAVATVLEGQSIDIRWKTDVSSLKVGSRILTIIKMQN
jgi:hypothetical protein